MAEKLAALVPDLSLTVRDIAEQTGASHQTAQNWRKRFLAGIPLPHTPKPPKPPPPPKERKPMGRPRKASAPETRSFIEGQVYVPDADVLTDDQMERILSSIAQAAQGPAQVQAIKLLEDLKDKHRPAERKGPEPPLTSEDRIVRLSRILECVTRAEAQEAFRRTYGGPEDLPPAIVHDLETEGEVHGLA